MSIFKSDYLNTLQSRGYIHQMTDEKGLDDQLCSKVVTAYIGFDLTAPSLHVGSLVQIMLLRHLQKCGHRPIVLMGGGTTKIGDPSGKDESRKMLDNATIDANKASIFKTFERFLTFGDGPTDAIMVDNADWLEGLSYIDFLRDVGPHFTINRMMTFDSVKLRLDREQPLTFLEFNYMILQAYDFMELARNFDCTLQLGGSDQWGNIVNGMELARRMDSRSTFGLTSPLITTADGGKMGKTAAGAVWLNEEQLSNHDYWQFWRNTQDADVGKFLRLFTELPLDEIERLEGLQGAALNDAKKILANKATTLCRGAEAAKRASESATTLFDEGGIDKSQTHDNGWFTDELLESGTIKILDVLVDNELCKSKKEARRLIEQGGARINNIPITDVSKILSIEDFNGQAALRLSAGKKRHTTLSRMPEITS